MADRTHKTSRKTGSGILTFKVASSKPRNPLVAPAMKRAAGPHRKSKGALRVAEEQALKRTLKKKDDDA